MRPRSVVLALAALMLTSAVVFGLGPMDQLSAMSPDGTILDMAPRGAAEAHAWLSRLGPEGRVLYRSHLVWDLGFLLVHGAAFFVLLRAGLQRVAPRWVSLAWFLVGLAVMDACENLLAACMLAAFPDGSADLATGLEVVTAAKLALVPILYGLAVLLAIAGWIRHVSRRGRQKLSAEVGVDTAV